MRKRKTEPITIARIERALLIAARCIELDGPVHLPAYERLERELDAMKRTDGMMERAKLRLEANRHLLQEKSKMDVLIAFLDANLREWPHGTIKFLVDVKNDIAAHSKKRTGIDGFEFHEGDDASIIRHMDAQPNFERATFGKPSEPSWKRR